MRQLKKIFSFIFILFISGVLHAQNWNTIIASDTNYFAVQASGADSMWQGYLRCIFTDASTVTSGISTNQFYASIRYDGAGNIDTSTGDTWLGRKNIVLPNRDEYYFNRRGDSILLKPLAQVGDTWVMLNDSIGRQFVATLVSSNTQMIDGILDSVKTIEIQAYSGASTVSSVYNSLPIVLSKAHGFYSLFEFYCFPYIDTITPLYQITSYLMPFHELPLPHLRVEKSITHVNYKHVDLAWKYTSGNFWQSSSGGLGDYSYWQDSVLGNNILTPDSITAMVYTDLFRKETIPFTTKDTMYHLLSTVNSSYIDTLHATISILTPEHKALFTGEPIHPDFFSNGFYWYFLDSVCGRVRLRDSFHVQTWVSGSFTKNHDYVTGFGLIGWGDVSFQVMLSGSELKVNYFNLGSCIYGSYVSVGTLQTPDILENANIVVYPNPANDVLHVDLGLLNEINTSLFDIQGRELKSLQLNNNQNVIDITDLTPGMYIIRVSNKTNSLYRKFIKE